MATARMTFGAVLSTIGETANMVTSTVKTGSDAIAMLNRFVDSASTDQKDRQLVHRKTFRDTLLRESRMQVAQSNKEVIDFCNENEDNLKLYKQAEELLPNDIFDN